MSGLNLDSYLPYRLSVTSNKISALIARVYEARFSLTITQWRILVILSGGGVLSQKDLIERTAMAKVAISRGVAALVTRGLVLRTKQEPDRRTDVLMLSKTGQDIVAEVVPWALKLEASLVDAIGGAQAQALDTMLRKLEAQAEALGE